MGNGSGGLQRQRRRLELLHPRSGPFAGLSLGRGWSGGHLRRQAAALFALALWNGKDAILKERLFGLTNSEGNHGEDVKEYYFYLDSTPTHSYMKYLYKYPQAAFPYADLVETNRRRSRNEMEYELLDTGVFDQDRYFDVFVEYAKDGPDDILMQITVVNRGPEQAELHVLPTLWFRNDWAHGLPALPRNRSSSRSRDRRARVGSRRSIRHWARTTCTARAKCRCCLPRTKRTTRGSFLNTRTPPPTSKTASTIMWCTAARKR